MSDLALDNFGELDLSTGGLRIVSGADAVAQHLKLRLRFVRGEWFLDQRVGIPYRTQIWVKNINLTAIQTVWRRAIESVPGVQSLERIDQSFNNATRELSVSFSCLFEGEDIARDFTEVFIL